MLIQLLVGSLVSVINIMIHALVTITRSASRDAAGIQGTSAAAAFDERDGRDSAGADAGATGEIFVWSLSYAIVGAAPDGQRAAVFRLRQLHHARLWRHHAGRRQWRLLGPMAAMNGILMFGWSTAVLFEVLRKTIEHLGAIAAPGTPFSAADRG